LSLAKELRSLRRILGGNIERRAIEKTHALVKRRVFVDGLDSSNRQIGTYSDAYTKVRQKAGLSGGRVILTFTGQMRNSFKLKKISGGYVSAFDTQEARNKAGWVESTYDTDIWELNSAEEDFLIDEIKKDLDIILNVG